jgi:glycosyltransferase involved in cell wall biosynthesis
MRICLVSHGFPPEERTGVETYTQALAITFAAAGHGVEVFTVHADADQADLALRRELRPEGFGLTRITSRRAPRTPEEALDPPGIAARFGDWLDRERPDIVHFQHVIKLGLGLVEEARSRGIPAVFTAHDYYGLCHRYTLMRPDLGVCAAPAAEGACARCDLATAVLNAVEGLGDYQMGVRPDELGPRDRARLVGTLDGDPVADGGFHEGEWEAALERRAALDARRRKVFQSFDLRLSPSAFLADRLMEAGTGPVELLPYGIVANDLEPLRSEAPAGGADKLRLLYIGGLAKHKGVEVLLDAFELLESEAPGKAELVVYGYSSDHVHVAALEARAQAVGASWRGAYARPELPRILAAADVVVVPSTWYENYPIAIREALAAGRPVVTSDHGALGESVEDGVDGRRFVAGDAADLARVLLEFTEPGVVAEYAARIAPVHAVAEQVGELVERYEKLIHETAKFHRATEGFDELPASMAGFVERVAELERTPLRELFEGVAAGLGRLGEGLGLSDGELRGDRLLARAFAEGDEAQRSLRDARREAEWLREALEGAKAGASSHAEEMDWAKTTLADRDATIASLEARVAEVEVGSTARAERATWLEETLAGEQEAREAVRAEAKSLRAAVQGLEEQVAWLSELRGTLETERDWLKRTLAERDELLAEAQRALEASTAREADLVAGIERERREREEFERVLNERLHQVAEVGLLALERQEHAMIQGLGPLFDALDRASGHRQDGAAHVIHRGLEELVGAVEVALERLGQLELELAWRRDQMAAAHAESQRSLVRLVIGRTGIGKRAEGWGGEA